MKDLKIKINKADYQQVMVRLWEAINDMGYEQQKHFALEIGCAPSSLSNILSGKRRISFELFLTICKYINSDPYEIIGDMEHISIKIKKIIKGKKPLWVRWEPEGGVSVKRRA